MPQYIGYSPWADAANVGRGLGATLTDVLINLPRLREQAELNRAHQEYYRAGAQSELAQKGLYEAQAMRQRMGVLDDMSERGLRDAETEYEKTRTGAINSEEQAKESIGLAMGQIPTTLQLGGSIGPLISDVLRGLPKLSGTDRNGLIEAMSQAIESDKPRYRQALGLGQSMLQPVTEGGSLYNAITGQTELQPQRVRLGYGQGYFDANTGEALAEGRDRPFNPSSRSSSLESTVAGAIARGLEGDPPEKVASAVQTAILQLRSGLGEGMPGGANAGVPKFRKNPATGKWERQP